MSLALPTNTGYAQFWGTSANAYQEAYGRAGLLAQMSRVINKRGNKATRALMRALNGAATGTTATATVTRVAYDAVPSGQRTIETVTLVNRATTAADVTAINAQLYDYIRQPSIAYPADLSGNGGKAFG